MEIKKEKIEFKKKFKKFWYLLWEDNSFKGWLFSIIFLFVFIKFIFFPTLNFVTGTTLPLAIVESCSMYHKGNIFANFDNWFLENQKKYELLGISQEEFSTFKLKNGFSKGDIIFIIKAVPSKLKVGDIIAFKSDNSKTPVIHRIVSIKQKEGELIFTTLGDNNQDSLTSNNNPARIDELNIFSDQIVGKAALRLVPGLGWIKLFFFEAFRSPNERGFCGSR